MNLLLYGAQYSILNDAEDLKLIDQATGFWSYKKAFFKAGLTWCVGSFGKIIEFYVCILKGVWLPVKINFILIM